MKNTMKMTRREVREVKNQKVRGIVWIILSALAGLICVGINIEAGWIILPMFYGIYLILENNPQSWYDKGRFSEDADLYE